MESVFRKFLSLAATVFILGQSIGQAALADETDGATAAHDCQHAESCGQNTVPGSVNLDLSSTAASVAFNGGCQSNQIPVNINVAGVAQTVNPGQMLTPAQAVAAYQVMRSGVQNILLGADGAAIGGSMVIGSHLAGMLNSIVIPTGVTVVDRTSTLNLAGNLTNSGTLLSVSTNPAVTTATISAANILNGQSGLLTTVLPESGLASLGYSNLVSNLNLNLIAINNIINSGIISSAGDLSMSAGGSIQNIMASPSAAAPLMQAAGTLSMLAPQITNAGMMQSLYGNINVLSSLASPNINITGTNGVMEALNGAINFRDALYTGTGNINLFGGDWLSEQLNLYSGTGAILGQVGQVTGIKTSYAGAEHFSANTANLILGDHCITGDPTYANTGNITISGNISPSEALAIIAGGSILGDGTSSISSNFAVTLVAGANITSGGGTGGETINNGSSGVVSPVSYVFDNTAGGNIDFTLSNQNPIIIATGSPITLLTNSNSSTTGNIWFPTSGTSVQTNNGSGNAGNILIVAGGSGGTAQSGAISSAIQTGALAAQSNGAGGNGGSVTIYTAAPVITGGTATYNTNGGLTAGSYPTASSSYTINNGSSINVGGNITTSGGAGTNGAAGVAGTNAGSGGNVTISAGTINTSSITTTGGQGGTGGGNGAGAGGAGGNSGNAGNVTLTAENAISIGAITANGATGGAAGAGVSGQGAQGGTPGIPGIVSVTSNSSSITASGTIAASGATGGLSRQGGTGGNGGNGVNGSSGQSITLSAGTFISAAGNVTGNGGAGSAGGAIGSSGGTLSGAGGNGGRAADITITAGTSISVVGNVNALGGTGQSAGTNSTTVQTTATGGNGGAGGTVQLTATSSTISIGNGIITTGGSGGVGRSSSIGGSGNTAGTITVNAGGSFSAASATANGGFGGAGGSISSGNGAAGGNSGSGNTVTITASSLSLSGGNGVTSNGGDAGFGGGTSGSNTAGNGGTSGSGGQISLTSTIGGISVTGGSISSNGGTAGSGSTGRGGNGGAGGTGGIITLNSNDTINVTVSISSTGGNGGGGSDASTTGGNGGEGGTGGTGNNISLTATGTTTTAGISSNGGSGGSGGAASGGGNAGGSGANGGVAGTLAVSTSASLTSTGDIQATGGVGGSGGTGSSGATTGNAGSGGNGNTITLTANQIALTGNLLANGNSTGTGSGSPTVGNGGTITVNDSSTALLTIGSATGANFISELVLATGYNGGRINLKTAGAVSIVLAGFLRAYNTSGLGAGGNILFANTTTGGNVSVANAGTIQASQLGVTSGIIGFSAGATGNITITGSGFITAGQYVNVGDVNTTTLAIQTPFTTVSPFTGTYTNNAGNITITQGSINGTLRVSDGPSPSPTPSSSSSSSSSSSATTPFLALLQSTALSQQLQAQLAQFNEQIGTRLATDYTPSPTVYNLEFPLQGNIQVDQIAGSGQAMFAAANFTKDQLDTLAAQGIVFGPKTGGNFFDLNQGYVLFMPTNDISVQTKEGIVSIPKGAIVWIMETGNDAAVYDLHDSANNPVKVLVNNKEMTLSPGKQILLTRDSKASFNALNPGNNIGTRNVSDKDMGQGIKAYIADFTILGGISNVQVMRELLKSNNPEHVKAAHKMLKNAAILSDLGGYKTPYKTKQ